MLVDSGASVSILRKDIFDKISPSSRPLIEPIRMNLLTATGEASQFIGKIKVEIKLGNHVFEHEILLAEIKDAAILGMDFLSKHGIDVLFSKGCIKVKGDTIPCFTHKSDTNCCRISVSETVEIPPESEMIIKGQTIGPVEYNSVGIVESSDKFVEKTGLLVAKAVVQQNSNIVPLRVANFSTEPKLVHKNTVAAIFETANVETTNSVRRVEAVASSYEGVVPDHLIDLFNKSSEKLDESQKEQLKQFLIEFQDVFSKNSSDIGFTDLVKHRINTADSKPIKQRPYRIPLAKREAAEKEIQDMLNRGIIEPSNSPWCSPIVMVTKKDGSIRFCCDFRKLNEATIKDCQPLPRIDDTLDALSGSCWYSVTDMRSGYWQCGLEESDREKTAFSIPGSGLWQFRVLCFGLCGAPATFERLVERVLSGLTWKICMVYLDDIIVFSKSFEEHLQNLREVCSRLKTANLKLHPSKCSLFQKEVEFLGHKISEKGVSTDDRKIEAVKNWPTPKNVKDVRSYLGLCSYYRRYVQNFASIAKPLHELTEKGRKFVWTDKCQEAFDTLKHHLTSSPILGYPKDDSVFILDTDASNVGMGAVLSQNQDGVERVISYFSKTFSKSERNYCVTRKELLAIVNAVKNFHHYLYGRPFLVRSDHGSLRWLMNFKNPEGQLARWLETLSAYDYTIVHRPGRVHCNADSLSRRPCPDTCSHCKKIENKDSLRVSVVGVEPKSEGSTNWNVVSVHTDPFNALTWPVKVFDGESNVSGNSQVNEKSRGTNIIDCQISCQEVRNEALSQESCAYSACIVDKVKNNRDNCSTEINTGVTNSLVSVYGAEVGKGGFERETSQDVYKSSTSSLPENTCIPKNHNLRPVRTRSMKKKESTADNYMSVSDNKDIAISQSNEELKNEQRNDPTLKLVLSWKENQLKPSWADVAKYSPEIKYFWNRLDSFEIKNDLLCRKWESEDGKNITWQIVIPEKFKASVLQQLHDSATGGHLGVKKTLSKVRQRYFWYGLRKFVEYWCHKCDICASRKSPVCKPKAPMRQYSVGAPLERVAIDIMGPLPTSVSGNKYLLVIADYFTKFVHALPMKNQEADTVARTFVHDFVTIFGVPMQVHTDQGANFESNLFKEVCKLLDIDKTRTTVMRPQSDGMAERHMRTLTNMLSSFVSENQKDWDQYIPLLMMAYRSSVHQTTGVSPCKMIFGREINLPVDLVFGQPMNQDKVFKSGDALEYVHELEIGLVKVHEFARKNMNLSSETMKKNYDCKIHHKLYNPGDPVWYYQYQRKIGLNPKLQRPWHGPYVVIDKLNDVLYRIKLGPRCKPKVVHHDKLKPYVGENRPTWF